MSTTTYIFLDLYKKIVGPLHQKSFLDKIQKKI